MTKASKKTTNDTATAAPSNMFELQQKDVKVSGFNPRAEKHGEDNKLAGDLSFEVNMGSAVLNIFSPGMRELLFRKPSLGEQQGLLDGEDLTQLGLPRLKYPLTWTEEFPGYGLQLESELGLAEPLVFEDVTVRNFTLEPMEGGTVKVKFSCILHPDEDEAGKLCALIQSKAVLTLTSPRSSAHSKPDLLDPLTQAANALAA